MDFPSQGIPFIKDFPLQWISLCTGFPFIRDCLLDGISIYKGFPLIRDFPLEGIFPLQGNSLHKGFPFTKDCIYDSPSGPLQKKPSRKATTTTTKPTKTFKLIWPWAP